MNKAKHLVLGTNTGRPAGRNGAKARRGQARLIKPSLPVFVPSGSPARSAAGRRAQNSGQTPGGQQAATGLRLPSAIPAADRLHAKDLARLEGCAPGTAARLMRSGLLGPVHGRNQRDRWIDRLAYQNVLDNAAALPPRNV